MAKPESDFKSFIKNYSMYLLLTAMIIIVIVAGAIGIKILNYVAVKEISEEGYIETGTLARHLESEIHNLQHAVKIMSGSPWIKPALITGSSNDIKKANLVLDRYKDELNASVCYLMDKDGLTIASSNRNTPSSFVGKNYAFRPYFKEAISGKQGQYFALGVTSMLRGFYTSYPVINEDNVIIGVAVIKKNIDEWESELKGYKYGFFVSPEGVIFLSSQKQARFKTFGELPAKIQEDLISSKQFGEKPFEALTEKKPVDRAYFIFNDKRLLVTEAKVGDRGWHVVLLNPTKYIMLFRAFGIIILILLLITVVGLWFYIHAKNEFTKSILESKELLGQIIEGSPIATFVLDKDHNVIHWNKACQRMTGIPQEEIKISNDISEIFYGKKRAILADLVVKGASKTELNRYYGANVKKSLFVEDGYESENFFPMFGESGKWIYSVAAPIKDIAGNTLGAIETLQDITQRKTIQETIKRSEENYRTIFDTANDGIFVHNAEDGSILDVNKKVIEMYGYSYKECLALKIGDLGEGKSPYSHEDAIEWMKKTAEEGPQIFEWKAKNKKGNLFWVEINLKFAVIEGKFRVLSIVRNIDKRKKTEEELKRAKAYAEHLFEISPSAIFTVDTDKKIVDWNRKAQEITGYSRDEVVGKECYMFTEDPCREKCGIYSEDVKKPIIAQKCTIRTKDGRIITVLKNANLLKDSSGNIIGAIESFEDVSDRKDRS